MTVTLHDVYTSSTDLLKRFDLIPTFDAAWNKVNEESQERIDGLNAPIAAPRREDGAI
jgi:hypothetical protein